MYEYGDSSVLNSNNGDKTVPNVMFDNTMPSLGKMEVQEGANLNMASSVTIEGGPQQTLPMYAIDGTVQQFEIPDPVLRRTFARKVFITLLLQHIITLPIIEIFIVCFDPISHPVIQGVRGVFFCILVGLYFFSDMRRYPPMNIVVFVIVTLLTAIEGGVIATWIHSQLAIFPHLIVIVQLLATVGYSEQTRYKFTVVNAILLVLLVSLAGHYLTEIVYSSFSFTEIAYALLSLTTYKTAYIIYDMHLMLSGHHGYNLQPNEYIFASTNIYADIPNLFWRMLKFFLITPLIKMYEFLAGCCFAEVF
ncbi:protein lifeguard 2 [Anastrepha obliqua]|uniref:protein lifeguard 2 n=1 Tax=Anastrepha ludens TaxID=28586 RepID=UPI0023AF2D18|nr:protein lifeguard 2 [Anastrepha ludens]XP_054739042.1 protein lifeguard 2 [Anastrepha obliqua]